MVSLPYQPAPETLPIPDDQRASPSSEVLAVGTAAEVARIFNIEKGQGPDDGEEYSDGTESLTSSIRQHIVDGGLRYHAYHAGQYAFPNDDLEQYRDDLKHDLTLHLCEGKHLLAPIEDLLKKGAQVLDLGMFSLGLADPRLFMLTRRPRHGEWKVVHGVYVSLNSIIRKRY